MSGDIKLLSFRGGEAGVFIIRAELLAMKDFQWPCCFTNGPLAGTQFMSDLPPLLVRALRPADRALWRDEFGEVPSLLTCTYRRHAYDGDRDMVLYACEEPPHAD